jgi:hypothetical protein
VEIIRCVINPTGLVKFFRPDEFLFPKQLAPRAVLFINLLVIGGKLLPDYSWVATWKAE